MREYFIVLPGITLQLFSNPLLPRLSKVVEEIQLLIEEQEIKEKLERLMNSRKLELDEFLPPLIEPSVPFFPAGYFEDWPRILKEHHYKRPHFQANSNCWHHNTSSSLNQRRMQKRRHYKQSL